MTTLLSNIPTNVITGFLGVGKTTAILHLLRHKPEHETWAVLVNEFGKVGIDGAVMEAEGVAVKEIAGGCMCCASGVSMQVGLNSLIARARPDRLLIEPTGIGHPRQIIQQLSQAPFDSVLDMRACICLIDPRHLSDERYITNEYYQEQLAAADVLVANKTDQASPQDKVAFNELSGNRNIVASAWVEQGRVSLEWLDLPRTTPAHKSLINLSSPTPLAEEPAPPILQEGEPYRRLESQGSEYSACGWIFAADVRFDYDSIVTCLQQMDGERIKATLQTNKGNYVLNGSQGEMGISQTNTPTENRIEIISRNTSDWSGMEEAIIRCTNIAASSR